MNEPLYVYRLIIFRSRIDTNVSCSLLNNDWCFDRSISQTRNREGGMKEEGREGGNQKEIKRVSFRILSHRGGGGDTVGHRGYFSFVKTFDLY